MPASKVHPIPLKILVPVMVVIGLSVVSYASTSSITASVFQTQYGLSYDVTGAFNAIDNGFSTTPSNAAASAQPCSWSNGGTCRTALTKGRYQYALSLTLNTVPSSTTTYTVTVKWDQGSGLVQMGQLTVSVSNTAGAGQSMTFKFDTGSTSITTPLSLDVTVA